VDECKLEAVFSDIAFASHPEAQSEDAGMMESIQALEGSDITPASRRDQAFVSHRPGDASRFGDARVPGLLRFAK
jgi:hypothetical protein